MLTIHRSALGGTVTALALVVTSTAGAQAVPPTVSFDASCYSPGDVMRFEGAGYTPDGAVSMFFGANGRFGVHNLTATPLGTIADSLDAPEPEAFLTDEQFATDMSVTTNDQARLTAGEPPESAVAMAEFRLSRWGVAWRSPSGRLAPGRKVAFRAVGFTHAVGRELFLHYRLGGRTVKSVRLGALAGPCGDRTTRLMRAFPFRVRPGKYKLTFNTSPRARAMPSVELATIRVTARDLRRSRAAARIAAVGRPSRWTLHPGGTR